MVNGMAIDPRFYHVTRPVNASDLAKFLRADITGNSDGLIEDLGPPPQSGHATLTFVSNKDSLVADFKGGVVITTDALLDKITNAAAVITVDNPRLAFASVAGWILGEDPLPGAAPSRDFVPQIDPSSSIAASAVIEDGGIIGANVTIGANSVIKYGVQIGDNCNIGDNCTISHCEMDDGCTVQSGVTIGTAGFGFEVTETGPVMVPHLGIVRIGHSVCIGANTAIDRGSLGDTVIGDQVMIDNLVHIAHNCQIGAGCVIAGQVGIAGSTTLGENVMIGGQAGVADHLYIGDGAVILARTGVTKDVEANAKMVGFPAIEAGKYWRDQAALRKLLRQPASKQKKD